jgi:hypothetical protein
VREDEIIDAYEQEFGEPDAMPPRRSNRGFWLVTGTLLLGCVLLVVEIFANRPLVGSIAHAESDLRAAEAIALNVRSQSGSFEGADAAGLAAVDPSRAYLGPDRPSAGLGQVSVYTSGDTWAAAVQVRGACFFILDRTGKDTLYGGGEVCTGRAALAADQSAW